MSLSYLFWVWSPKFLKTHILATLSYLNYTQGFHWNVTFYHFICKSYVKTQVQSQTKWYLSNLHGDSERLNTIENNFPFWKCPLFYTFSYSEKLMLENVSTQFDTIQYLIVCFSWCSDLREKRWFYNWEVFCIIIIKPSDFFATGIKAATIFPKRYWRTYTMTWIFFSNTIFEYNYLKVEKNLAK